MSTPWTHYDPALGRNDLKMAPGTAINVGPASDGTNWAEADWEYAGPTRHHDRSVIRSRQNRTTVNCANSRISKR